MPLLWLMQLNHHSHYRNGLPHLLPQWLLQIYIHFTSNHLSHSNLLFYFSHISCSSNYSNFHFFHIPSPFLIKFNSLNPLHVRYNSCLQQLRPLLKLKKPLSKILRGEYPRYHSDLSTLSFKARLPTIILIIFK